MSGSGGGRSGLGARTTTDAVPLLPGLPVLFIVTYALLAWGHEHGAVLGPPLIPTALITVFGAIGDERWQRFIGGGRLHTRPVLRLCIATAIMATTLLVTGWGFLLPACATLIVVVHIGWSGSHIWRHAALITAAATLLSEGAVQAGLIASVVPATYSHIAAAIGMIVAGFSLSNLGLSAAHGEQAALAVQRAEERYRALVRNSSDVVAVIDADGRVTHVSDAVHRVSGWSADELLGTTYLDLLHPEDQDRTRTVLAELTSTGAGSQARLEVRSRHHDGTWHWHEMTLCNALNDPAVQGIVCNERNVHDRRVHQDRVAHAAAHDSLTGLPNRAEMLRQLAVELAGADEPVAVFYIDLDGFKRVNDTYGHAVGDDLLVAAAQRLRAGLRHTDALGRLGGDEFFAILPGSIDPEAIHARARQIMEDMRMPFDLPGQRVRIGASIGVQFGAKTTDADALLACADAEMYSVKRGSTNRRELPTVEVGGPAQRSPRR